MRWFKHFSDASNDLFIKDFEREFGDAGYAFWFKVLELIAKDGTNGRLNISWANLLERLAKTRPKVLSMLARCEVAGKLTLHDDGIMVRLVCSKFAEFSSEYEQRKNRRRKSVGTDVDIEEEGEVDTDKIAGFEALWSKYPNRQGKKNAYRHYRATVKTPEDRAMIIKALENYLASGNVKRGFVKNGSTWFNEWQDWINPTNTMMEDKKDGKRKSYQFDPSKFPTFRQGVGVDTGSVRQGDGVAGGSEAGELPERNADDLVHRDASA